MIPSKEEEHKKEVDRLHSIHVLANEKVRLNDTIGVNNELKVAINTMRKEIHFAKDSIQKMENQIQDLKNKITVGTTESIANNRTAGETNNQILALKAKHEEEKERFEVQIKKLQERLKEKDDPIEFDDKSFKVNNDPTGVAKTEFANPIAILIQRVNKIKAINRKKKHLVDQYVRHASIIEQAFETIRENSGISNIEEIVTTFIKAEEQNYSLYNYVNLLGQETDALEDNNQHLDRQIEIYKEIKELSAIEKKNKIQQLKDKKNKILDEIDQTINESDNIQAEFSQIKDFAFQMVKQFHEAKFTSTVANKMTYDEET